MLDVRVKKLCILSCLVIHNHQLIFCECLIYENQDIFSYHVREVSKVLMELFF